MTHRNSAGKQAMRVAIFKAYLEPQEALAATQYVGPTNYLSLVWTSETEACLYVHDEFTPGGHLIACTGLAAPEVITGLRYDDCTIYLDLSDAPEVEGVRPVTRTVSLEVPDLCKQATDLTLNVETNQLCVVMSDGEEFCVDLTPVLPVYDVRENPEQEGQFCFYNGDTQVICWWEGGFSVKNPDGSVTITNPDGTTVEIPAPLEAQDIDIRHNIDQTVCLVVDGAEIGCWQQGDIVSEDTVLGVHKALKPDGSEITWLGTDHITTASLNAVERSVTIVNPDGQTITFPYLDELPEPTPQTEVSNASGSLANQNTYTVDHKGTWPNETIRTMWGERAGDIVELNFWNPAQNKWDAVAIEAPENIVILNNPVIYIRESGSANPPINDQSDLTVANAFNSFDAVRSFMNRTLTVGTVTLDVRGNFLTTMGNFGPGQFKNAQNIVVRGDPENVTAFRFRVGMGDGSALGMQGTGGTVTFRDCTAAYVDEAVQPGRASPFQALSGCTIRLGGTIRFEGIFNTERPGSATGHLGYAIGGNIDIASGTTLNIALNAAAQLNSGFAPQSQAQITLGANVVFQMQSLADLGDAFIFLASGASMRSVVTGGEPPVVTGTQRPKAGHSVRVSPLAAATFAGYPAPVRQFDFGIDQTGTTTQANMFVSTVGTLNNSLGTDV